MIDFLKFNDDISDEMLAAYIDGNATEEESSRIRVALSSDETLLEATEVVNDFNTFATGDVNAIEDVLSTDEIPIDVFQDDIMVAAAAAEPSEIDSIFPFSDTEIANNDLLNMSSGIVESSDDLDF